MSKRIRHIYSASKNQIDIILTLAHAFRCKYKLNTTDHDQGQLVIVSFTAFVSYSYRDCDTPSMSHNAKFGRVPHPLGWD